jgi:hypothetical protein
MGEKTQLNLRLEKSTKDKWEEYVDESGEFSTLSQLIRAAVSNEMKGRQTGDSTPHPEGMSDEIGDLQASVDVVEEKIEELQHTADRTLEEVAERDMDFSAVNEPAVLQHVPGEKPTVREIEGETFVPQPTKDMIAQETDVTPSEVQYRLEQAVQRGDIQKGTVRDITVYWRDGDE